MLNWWMSSLPDGGAESCVGLQNLEYQVTGQFLPKWEWLLYKCITLFLKGRKNGYWK